MNGADYDETPQGLRKPPHKPCAASLKGKAGSDVGGRPCPLPSSSKCPGDETGCGVHATAPDSHRALPFLSNAAVDRNVSDETAHAAVVILNEVQFRLQIAMKELTENGRLETPLIYEAIGTLDKFRELDTTPPDTEIAPAFAKGGQE